jgi:hypothetical protein
MSKNTYQTYTEETPISGFRSDFVHRGAMCAALGPRYPDLKPIAAECDALVSQIDGKLSGLQRAEDDQIRARAIEIAEKLDVTDLYTELRRTMFAKSYDIATLLPDAPSSLKRLGIASTSQRISVAISNLSTLPDSDEIKAAFLSKLQKEAADLEAAGRAEDKTTLALQSGRVALTLYKSELSQTREAHMGRIQTALADREKTATFTLPWRKSGKSDDEPATAPTKEPTPGPTPAPNVT